MDKNTQASGSVGIGGLLFVLFVGLKLTGYIGWSWWWITSPLWLPVLAILIIGGFFYLAAVILDR